MFYFLPMNGTFTPLRACRRWTSGHPERWPLASERGCSGETSPGLHVQPWPLMTLLPCLKLTLPAVAGYESLCEDQNDGSHKRLAHRTGTHPEFRNWHHLEVKRERKGNRCESKTLSTLPAGGVLHAKSIMPGHQILWWEANACWLMPIRRLIRHTMCYIEFSQNSHGTTKWLWNCQKLFLNI